MALRIPRPPLLIDTSAERALFVESQSVLVSLNVLELSIELFLQVAGTLRSHQRQDGLRAGGAKNSQAQKCVNSALQRRS